ncbi:MAG: YceI family protein [Steroidobacteraceae bacterium]
MRRLHRVALLLSLSALLAACPRPVRPPAPPPSLPPTPSVDTRGATIYRVDPQSSELHIQVLRGGTLSKLGHNHVVSSRKVTGRAWVHPEFSRSGFELTVPVNDLVVDDPQARRKAGSEFPPQVPQADKDGTRKNMLRPDVLDGERFREITVKSAQVSGTLQAPRVVARITIKDVSRDVSVPVKIATTGGQLTASGAFDIQQSDFGIKPFTAALGALAVQDRLHITFEIVATRSSGS